MLEYGDTLPSGVGREEKEQALQEGEGWYRGIVETIRKGIAFISPEEAIIEYCNPAYAGIFGLAPQRGTHGVGLW